MARMPSALVALMLPRGTGRDFIVPLLNAFAKLDHVGIWRTDFDPTARQPDFSWPAALAVV